MDKFCPGGRTYRALGPRQVRSGIRLSPHRAQPQLLNLRWISVKESPLAIHKQNFTGKREIKAAFCCVLRIKVVFAVLWRKVAAAPTAADYRLTTYLMSASVSAAANLQICLQLHLWTFIPLYLGQVTAASSSRDGVFSVYG